MVQTLCFHAGGAGLIPAGGTQNPYTFWHSQKQTNKQTKTNEWSNLKKKKMTSWIQWGLGSLPKEDLSAMLCLVPQLCPTLCFPMDYSPPGSSVHGGFLRQEYWSGLLCPPPGDLPNPGIKPRSPTLQVDSLLSEPPRKPSNLVVKFNIDCQTRGDKAICVVSVLLWFIKYRESFLEFSWVI